MPNITRLGKRCQISQGLARDAKHHKAWQEMPNITRLGKRCQTPQGLARDAKQLPQVREFSIHMDSFSCISFLGPLHLLKSKSCTILSLLCQICSQKIDNGLRSSSLKLTLSHHQFLLGLVSIKSVETKLFRGYKPSRLTLRCFGTI